MNWLAPNDCSTVTETQLASRSVRVIRLRRSHSPREFWWMIAERPRGSEGMDGRDGRAGSATTGRCRSFERCCSVWLKYTSCSGSRMLRHFGAFVRPLKYDNLTLIYFLTYFSRSSCSLSSHPSEMVDVVNKYFEAAENTVRLHDMQNGQPSSDQNRRV